MGRVRTTLAAWLVVAVALACAGCGDGDGATPQSPPPETPQALPKLPKRWRAHADESLGYKIGVPPGWDVGWSGTGGVKAAMFRSPDHLVAMTLVATRDPEALEVPLDEFATNALASLPGFREQLEPSTPRPFAKTPFAAVQTEATGTTKARKIKEHATLLVLRREGIVNYTVAIVANARRPYARKDRAVAFKMIRTLRGRPIGGLAPADSR